MIAFDQAWVVVKTDFDFIEGVPWEKRVDHIARKLANHYSPGEGNEKEYKYQKRILEQEIERRKGLRHRSGKLMFPTDESQHDSIGPGFYGQYSAPDTDFGFGEELHDERIIFNLPEMYDSVKSKARRDAGKQAAKEVARIMNITGRGNALDLTTDDSFGRYQRERMLRNRYERREGPGTDRFERKLIDRLNRNTNHEFGHAITHDEIERFDDEMIDWDAYDHRAERTKDDPLSRHQHASEALAHIMENPHNPNWRESFESHDDIRRWLVDDETREKYWGN